MRWPWPRRGSRTNSTKSLPGRTIYSPSPDDRSTWHEGYSGKPEITCRWNPWHVWNTRLIAKKLTSDWQDRVLSTTYTTGLTRCTTLYLLGKCGNWWRRLRLPLPAIESSHSQRIGRVSDMTLPTALTVDLLNMPGKAIPQQIHQCSWFRSIESGCAEHCQIAGSWLILSDTCEARLLGIRSICSCNHFFYNMLSCRDCEVDIRLVSCLNPVKSVGH